MLKTLIIDDEEKAISTLERLINRYCSYIKIVGTALSVDEALKLVNQEKPDLLFLDIVLQDKTAFDLLNSIPQRNFEVVFVTAYNEYAIRAFKYSAIDYLVKPVDAEELISTIERMKSSDPNTKTYSPHNFNLLMENLNSEYPLKIAVKSSYNTEYINLKDILYFQADGKYSKLKLISNNFILTSKNLGEYQEILEENKFMRIHKSYIVNLNGIHKINKHKYEITLENKETIPISRDIFETFEKRLNKFSKILKL